MNVTVFQGVSDPPIVHKDHLPDFQGVSDSPMFHKEYVQGFQSMADLPVVPVAVDGKHGALIVMCNYVCNILLV